MPDEYIDIFDEQNNPIGKKALKSEAHRKGLWHRAAHIWIYNLEGKVLLQRRAYNKSTHPGLWDISAAGHLAVGEEPIKGATREVNEELGLSVSEADLEFIEIDKSTKYIPENNYYNRSHDYLYLMEYSGDIRDMVIQQEELAEIRFVKIAEFEAEINHQEKYQEFVQHGDHYFHIIDLLKNRV